MSLRFAILGILDRQPMHGYELKRVLDEHVSLFWPVKLAAIYPSLKRLEEDGLVQHHMEHSADGRPDRKVYRVTDDGRRELESWLATPPEFLQEGRVPLFLKFFVARPEHYGQVLDWVNKSIDLFRERRGLITDAPLPDKPEYLLLGFMRDSGIAHVEMQIELLEELRARLTRHLRQAEEREESS